MGAVRYSSDERTVASRGGLGGSGPYTNIETMHHEFSANPLKRFC